MLAGGKNGRGEWIRTADLQQLIVVIIHTFLRFVTGSPPVFIGRWHRTEAVVGLVWETS